jgi:voltage-gated potassium channel
MTSNLRDKSGLKGLRLRIHEIIFEADTFAGKLFDLTLIGAILISVAVVMLDSVEAVHKQLGTTLYLMEWVFTVFFSIEYILRIYCVRKPFRYVFSFYGIIDLLAIIPTFISAVVPGTRYIFPVRILRVCRIFRVLKLSQYLGEANLLIRSLIASRRRIIVFLFAVLSIAVILGSVMHMVEGPAQFTSIPKSVYWAIVTLTTVGYGDIKPETALGQSIASFIMILGYSIIAIPTGIITAEMVQQKNEVSTQACPSCSKDGHDPDAVHCKYCGEKL